MMVIDSYIDRAFSAKTDNRPEFQRMIKDSAKRLFDVVIVWKLDRFARNRYDSAHYKATLRKNGVKVVSAMEAIAEDSTGILLESLLEGYAEFYSAELSEKVIRGRTENALKCKWNGGCMPLGLKVDVEKRFVINPLTAPLVLEAFQMYAAGVTVKEIAETLNVKGIHSRHGGSMNVNSITTLLHNRKYIGEYRYRDILHENGIPAIVPKELFDQVQERLAKNKKAPARFKARDELYLLTTKLFCGKCGAYMIGESGTSHTGRIYQYYKCASAKNRKGCDKKAVKKAWIEDLVMAEVAKILLDDVVIDRIVDAVMELQDRENTALPFLQKQLDETNKGLENIVDAIQQGFLTSSTKERLVALEESKKELEMQILQEELCRPKVSEEKVRFWLSKFREGDMQDPKHRQRLIDSFVNAIYLYDDKIILTFNYKDGSATVTLAEIESSITSSGSLPNHLPSIDKRNFVDRWFFDCPKVQ